jgi:flagellar motor switch protein FliN/FliY
MSEQAKVSSVEFPQFSDQTISQEQQSNLGILMDVNVELSVELGRARRSIKDVLSFGEGSIVELSKLAGDPVDLLINGKLIGHGEVVVIDENFGIRITEIINKNNLLSSLDD